MANDANCFAISEATDGAGRDCRVVFGVILGTGVGGGLVVDRKVVTGANAVSGEWGHTPLPWMNEAEYPGRFYYCGRHGCIETFISGPAFEANFAEATGQTLTAAQIVTAAADGDALPAARWRAWRTSLADPSRF